VAPDQCLDELLLGSDELDAVALELLGCDTDGAHRLPLVDEPADLVAQRLDRGELDDRCVLDEA
jgi:hypothetical protein